MQPLTEREVADVVAVNVEVVRVLVSTRVAVSGTEQQQHGAAGRHRRPVTLEIPRHIAGYVRPGGFEAKCLIDRTQEQ